MRRGGRPGTRLSSAQRKATKGATLGGRPLGGDPWGRPLGGDPGAVAQAAAQSANEFTELLLASAVIA